MPRILIIGAGAMGIIIGHILHSAGATITYLVRPRRQSELARPQILYSYDDDKLISFSGYDLITSPREIERDVFDFIIFTIDGVALRSEEGEGLTRTVGEAARGTRTNVLIGTIGINLRPRFLSLSGLSPEQVFNGGLYIAVYQVDRLCLPIHPPTNPGLLEQADFAYRQPTPVGLFIDDSAPVAAQRFAALYNASGTSQCATMSAQDYSTQVPAAFPIFMACHLAGWVTWKEFARHEALWTLTTAAVHEIQDLSINGSAGQKARQATTSASLLNSWRQLEEMMLPLDFLGFNRFHHGGKVLEQDIRMLEDCLALGNAEGKPMSALKELTERARNHPRQKPI